MQLKSMLLLLVTAAIFSCSRANYFEHQPLSNLPSQAHDQPVEVFFEDNAEPQRDYIEFYDLRLVKRGTFTDRQMLKLLQAEAQKKGLDAVTNVNKWTESEERTTLIDVLAAVGDDTGYEPTTTVSHSVIEAKGIKYIENIDLSNSVKTGTVYDESTGEKAGEIQYLPNGLINETISENDEAKLMLDIYFMLSEDHLLHEQADWQTKHHHDGQIDIRRKYRMNDWLLKRVRVKYGPHHKLIRTLKLVENPDENPLITKISYSYDQSGKLKARKASGTRMLTEKLIYAHGKLQSRIIQFGGRQYRVELSYYQQADLKELVKKVE